MARRFDCPYAENCWIELPDEWLGKHAVARENALQSMREQKISDTGIIADLTVSLTLAVDFRLPGLEGKPELWNLAELPLDIIAWVTEIVGIDFNKSYAIPKAHARTFLSGRARTKTTMTEKADTAQMTAPSTADGQAS